MRRMSDGIGRKGAWVWAVVAVPLLIAGVVPASAAPAQGSERDYYSDGTYSNQVGMRIVQCTPPYVVTTGTVTSFSRIVDYWEC